MHNKWTNEKYLLGCALFADLFPYSIFSKCMQADEMDILHVGALTNLLQTIKETNKLNMKPRSPLMKMEKLFTKGKFFKDSLKLKISCKLITKSTASVSLNESEHIYPGLIFNTFET